MRIISSGISSVFEHGSEKVMGGTALSVGSLDVMVSLFGCSYPNNKAVVEVHLVQAQLLSCKMIKLAALSGVFPGWKHKDV